MRIGLFLLFFLCVFPLEGQPIIPAVLGTTPMDWGVWEALLDRTDRLQLIRQVLPGDYVKFIDPEEKINDADTMIHALSLLVATKAQDFGALSVMFTTDVSIAVDRHAEKHQEFHEEQLGIAEQGMDEYVRSLESDE